MKKCIVFVMVFCILLGLMPAALAAGPKITKQPESATTNQKGTVTFQLKASGFKGVTWRFVNPVTGEEITGKQLNKMFRKIKISGVNSLKITLKNVPEEMHGWYVYCRLTGNGYTTDSEQVRLLVYGMPEPEDRPDGGQNDRSASSAEEKVIAEPVDASHISPANEPDRDDTAQMNDAYNRIVEQYRTGIDAHRKYMEELISWDSDMTEANPLYVKRIDLTGDGQDELMFLSADDASFGYDWYGDKADLYVYTWRNNRAEQILFVNSVYCAGGNWPKYAIYRPVGTYDLYVASGNNGPGAIDKYVLDSKGNFIRFLQVDCLYVDSEGDPLQYFVNEKQTERGDYLAAKQTIAVANKEYIAYSYTLKEPDYRNAYMDYIAKNLGDVYRSHGLYDIDQDGVPELIVYSNIHHGAALFYTYADGEVYPLNFYGDRPGKDREQNTWHEMAGLYEPRSGGPGVLIGEGLTGVWEFVYAKKNGFAMEIARSVVINEKPGNETAGTGYEYLLDDVACSQEDAVGFLKRFDILERISPDDPLAVVLGGDRGTDAMEEAYQRILKQYQRGIDAHQEYIEKKNAQNGNMKGALPLFVKRIDLTGDGQDELMFLCAKEIENIESGSDADLYVYTWRNNRAEQILYISDFFSDGGNGSDYTIYLSANDDGFYLNYGASASSLEKYVLDSSGNCIRFRQAGWMFDGRDYHYFVDGKTVTEEAYLAAKQTIAVANKEYIAYTYLPKESDYRNAYMDYIAKNLGDVYRSHELYDIDQDGVPELIIYSDIHYGAALFYTYADGEVYPLNFYGDRPGKDREQNTWHEMAGLYEPLSGEPGVLIGEGHMRLWEFVYVKKNGFGMETVRSAVIDEDYVDETTPNAHEYFLDDIMCTLGDVARFLLRFDIMNHLDPDDALYEILSPYRNPNTAEDAYHQYITENLMDVYALHELYDIDIPTDQITSAFRFSHRAGRTQLYAALTSSLR